MSFELSLIEYQELNISDIHRGDYRNIHVYYEQDQHLYCKSTDQFIIDFAYTKFQVRLNNLNLSQSDKYAVVTFHGQEHLPRLVQGKFNSDNVEKKIIEFIPQPLSDITNTPRKQCLQELLCRLNSIIPCRLGKFF